MSAEEPAGSVVFCHPELGFSIPLPEWWERHVDVEGIALIAIEPDRQGAFRANLVVTAEVVDPGTQLDAWVEAGIAGLAEHTDRLLVLDVEDTQLAGRPARRTLSSLDSDGHAVTLEQWALLDGQYGYVLSASAGTLDYPGMADLHAAMAEQFRLSPEPAV